MRRGNNTCLANETRARLKTSTGSDSAKQFKSRPQVDNGRFPTSQLLFKELMLKISFTYLQIMTDL